MKMQSTYWLEKVLKMISLYVNALSCTLQHIVDAIQRCQFSELTPLSCIACMTICCSLTDFKSVKALRHKPEDHGFDSR